MLSGKNLPAEWAGIRRALEARQEEARRAILQGFQREAQEKAWAKVQAEEAAQIAAQAAAAELAKKAARKAAKALRAAKAEAKTAREAKRAQAKRLRRATEAGRKAGLQAREARATLRAKLAEMPVTGRQAAAVRAELKAAPTPAQAFKAAYTAVLEGRKAGCIKAKTRRKSLSKTMHQVAQVLNGHIPKDLSQAAAKIIMAVYRHRGYGRTYMSNRTIVSFVAKTGATVDEALSLQMSMSCNLWLMSDPSILSLFRELVAAGYDKGLIGETISLTDNREEENDTWVVTEAGAILAKNRIERLKDQVEEFNEVLWTGNSVSLPAHKRYFADIRRLYSESFCWGLSTFGAFPAKGFVPEFRTKQEVSAISMIWPLFAQLAKTKRWPQVKAELDVQVEEEFKEGPFGFNLNSVFDSIGEAILGWEVDDYYERLHSFINVYEISKYTLLDSSWKGFHGRYMESLAKKGIGYYDANMSAFSLMFGISRRFTQLAKLGITAKSSVSNVLAAIDSVAYDGSNGALMAEAARWKVSEDDYLKIEKRWDNGLTQEKNDFIKALQEVEIKSGSRRIFMLPHEDVRGVFLGEHTNCCQHPGGAGSEAAWYGHEKAHAGYVVIEESGNILAQGLVWQTKSSNTLCFDNIEAKGGSSRVAQLIPAFQSWCKAAKISATMGTGYMASEAFCKLDLAVTQEPLDGWSSLRYTDALDQRVLHMA